MKLGHAVMNSVARRLDVQCALCRKPVQNISVEENPFVENDYRVIFYCHGAIDYVTLATRDQDSERFTSAVPRKAFLPSVAQYGAVSAEARRERRARHGAA